MREVVHRRAPEESERLTARERLERYFEFQALGADWKTEVLAGATTFITMAYIVFVNPTILRETGMPFTAVVAATCLSAAFGSIMMGAFARYPIALAPGMGLNAYFTYTVVKGMGVPWQTALGAVFFSGVAFFILTLTGLRQLIIAAIPAELYAAVAAGVGLFIAFIGLRNAGIILPDPATTVTLGNLRNPNTLLAIFGLLLIALLLAWGVKRGHVAGDFGNDARGRGGRPRAVEPAELQPVGDFGDGVQAGRGGDTEDRPARDCFRIFVRRSVR